MLNWSRYIHGVTEKRRLQAAKQGEAPPDIKGVSNYERAEIMARAHRAMKITPLEKWIGRGLMFAVPLLILTVFLINMPVGFNGL